MNLYDKLFGDVLDPPRIIVDINAIATNGFIGTELGKGGSTVMCFGDAEIGDRVIVDQNGTILQKINKLDWVEVIL
ncbi:MAG: hypothetical protein ACRCXK_02020 [Wohlfahrtiimonas sp.]